MYGLYQKIWEVIVILYIEIAGKLKERIEKGEFKEGQKLISERKIAEEYGVSRNVVREALKSLNQQGLLNIIPAKGAFVTKPDTETLANSIKLLIKGRPNELMQMMEVREILEIAIIENVISEASDENVHYLLNLYDQMDEFVDNTRKFMKLDEEFHTYLRNIVKNEILISIVTSLNSIVRERLFSLRVLYPERNRIAQEDHYDMIKGIRTHNLDLAKRAVKRHMDGLRIEIMNLKDFSG